MPCQMLLVLWPGIKQNVVPVIHLNVLWIRIQFIHFHRWIKRHTYGAARSKPFKFSGKAVLD